MIFSEITHSSVLIYFVPTYDQFCQLKKYICIDKNKEEKNESPTFEESNARVKTNIDGSAET